MAARRSRRSAPSSRPARSCSVVSGNVAQPGVYEVPFGKTLRDLMELAGGVAERPIAAGDSARRRGRRVRRPERARHPADVRGRARREGHARVGRHRRVRRHASICKQILLRIASFFRDESCGQCVPCRVGTVRQEEALYRIASGRDARRRSAGEIALLDEVGLAMKDASICGLGQTAYAAIESAIHRVGVFKERTAVTAVSTPLVQLQRPTIATDHARRRSTRARSR